jgi:hypothetical protein
MKWFSAALLLFWAGPAGAEEGLRYLEDDYRSPQHFALELRLGPYYPDVDDEFDGSRPFHDTFHDNKRLRVGAEFDWQILHTPVGSLGVGLAVGLMRFVANARFEGSNERSSETTTLNIIPIAASVVARFDGAMNSDWEIPLVPYLKLGLADYLWFAEDASGGAKADGPEGPDSVKGVGSTLGFEFAPGIAFLLDFLEPSAARKFDADAGVNHSYVFLELLVARVDGFGANDVMIFSDTTWNAGLMLEF